MSDWYTTVHKPPWAPPSWLFGAAWAVIYALYAALGLAIALAYANAGTDGGTAAVLGLYAGALAWNLLWVPLFRDSASYGSFAWIVALLALVAALLVAVATRLPYRHRVALALVTLAPYALWLCFAAALSFSIARLN